MKTEYQIDQQKKNVQLMYARRRRKGSCPRCGKEKEFPEKAHCVTCTNYKNAYMKQWRLDNPFYRDKKHDN